jgi:hypothetical protein
VPVDQLLASKLSVRLQWIGRLANTPNLCRNRPLLNGLSMRKKRTLTACFAHFGAEPTDGRT